MQPWTDAFNRDTCLQRRFLELAEIQHCYVAVETGSYHGTTTGYLANNFRAVYSIESKKEYFEISAKALMGRENVFLTYGDSSVKLAEILGVIKENTIFFLDAHWSASLPLVDELNQIAQWAATTGFTPTIVIHDFKTIYPTLGYDTYNNQPIGIDLVKDAMDLVYPKGYSHWTNTPETASGAMRGVGFFSQPIPGAALFYGTVK